MSVRRGVLGLLCCVLLAPAAASAVTIDQIVAMSKAGVSDAVIVALIERDKTVFTLDPAQLVELQQAGVTEAVTVAMIRSDGVREQPPNVSTPEQPTVALPEQPAVVTYAVPYAVPVRVRRSRVLVAAPAAPTALVPPTVTSARGIFFTQPATGIFFQPPAGANCQPPAASPHRR